MSDIILYPGAAVDGDVILRDPRYPPSSDPWFGLVSTADLKAHWTLDEATGTRNDSFGTHHLSDNGGVTALAAKISNGADFIPPGRFLSKANHADLQSGDFDFQFTCWIKSDDVSVDAHTVFGMWGDTDANNAYRLLTDSSGNLVFYFQRHATDTRSVTLGVIAAGTWYFISCGHNAATDQLFGSINNGTVITAASGGIVTNVGTEEFRIGSNSGASPLAWNGLIDEVSRFNRILTAGEKDALYNGGSGLLFGGAAPVTYTYVASGGMTFAGAALVSQGKAFVATGGLLLGGAATLSKTKDYPVSGGLTLAGSATVTASKTFVASGGLSLSGAADKSRTVVVIASGGLTFGGAALTAQSASFSYTASGGLTLAGAGELAMTKAYSASGGVVLGGAATVSQTRTYTATGGLAFGGVAELARTVVVIASGGIAFGGAALTATTATHSYVASGGVALSGAADLAITKDFTSSGGLTHGGAALTSFVAAGSPEPEPEPEPAPSIAGRPPRVFWRKPKPLLPTPVAFVCIGRGGMILSGSALTAFEARAPDARKVSISKPSNEKGKMDTVASRATAPKEIENSEAEAIAILLCEL